MDTNADIVVVGCGVAGATAAETAASLGSRVLLLEEHDRIGVPSHCAGHVGIRSMKRFCAPLPDKIIKSRIRGAIITSPSGQVLRLERPEPITWVLDRVAFDQHLALRAEKAGAQILLNCRAVSADTQQSETAKVQVKKDGKTSVVHSKVIIDCEGVASTLTERKAAMKGPRSMWVNSAQLHVEHMKDLDCEMVEVYLGSSYAPGFFAWVIPWRDESAMVGLAAREGNPRLLLERFVTRHPKVSSRLNSVSLRNASFRPIPLGGPISRTYYSRMLTAGDSAQQVKPTTGGGIVFSLICGRAAGQVAHEASVADDASASFLSKYEKRWKRVIGRDFEVMRRIRRMLFRLPDHQLNKIFAAASRLDLSSVLSKADDIDMQGRTLARLGADPRLAIFLLYSSVISVPSSLNREGHRLSSNKHVPRE